MTILDAARTPIRVANAIRSARPAARLAALAGALFLACCFARSDARPESDPSRAFDATHIVGTWYARPQLEDPRNAFDDAGRMRDALATAQGMLSTPKFDGAAGVPTRVNTLRVDVEMHSRRVAVTLDPEIRVSAHLAPGARKLIRSGTPAYAWITERVTYWNDVPVDRQIVSREMVGRGTPAIVLEGTPKTLAQLHSNSRYRIAAMMTMVATAYTADTATAYPTGYTATGILAHQGIVAVDPSVIPLGSTVFVPGYGIAIAADTGGAIIGRRIDLCMDSYPDAINFGRQTVQVYLLKR